MFPHHIMSLMQRRFVLALVLWWTLAGGVFATPIQWIGNTRLWVEGNSFPRRGAAIEAYQTLTVTTETWPIGPGQRVVAVVTTNGFQTTQEYEFSFDYNANNNTHWYVVLGPFPKNSWVDFYLRAEGSGGPNQYDNNGWANFGYLSRPAPRQRSGAILQWFETDYRTILRRLPEVVLCGYSAIYLPAPQKSGGGGFSVGYNPFDHFDLGDRPQKGSYRTKYGTTQELIELIRAAKRLGLEVYCDLVLNHADNRASTPIDAYPGLIPEDFHIRSSANPTNDEIDFNTATAFSAGMLNRDLVGLADIAHEDGNAAQTGTFALPSYATFNQWGKPSFVRHPLNPQYYPGASAPYAEDVRQYLGRWCRWLVGTIGFDGFRLDAVKHIPPAFLGYAPDQAGPGSYGVGNLLPSLLAMEPDLYLFSEDYTSSAYELREYAKTGTNLLDFPLVFRLRDVFNSNGFGNLGAAFSNGYGIDSSTGLPYENGGLAKDVGVSFVQSHDDGPPTSSNLAYALISTRKARPKVYYDGDNVLPGDWAHFPRPGRADALRIGGDMARLMDARNRFARGTLTNRYVGDRLYIFERRVDGKGVLLVGLNNRGDDVALTQTVDTSFAPGTVLEDLSVQRPDVTVASDGRATVTVPSNGSATSPNNGRGYVLYAPRTPKALPDTLPVNLTVSAGSDNRRPTAVARTSVPMPYGTYGTPQSYPVFEVRTRSVDVTVRTDSTGVAAYAKLDDGLPMAGLAPLAGTPEGLTDGFVPMRRLENGLFTLPGVDLGSLPDGLHVLRVRVFLPPAGGPGLFSEFATFVAVRMGLGGAVAVDGALTDLGTPVALQQRTASSNLNRLDALYLTNDDRFLYVGLAGRVDSSESFSNGSMLFIDVDPDAGTGVRDFSALNDDSGPAARLLSNPRVQAPSGFGAEFGLGVFRDSQLHSAPETAWVGGPTVAPAVGAQAGLFRLDAGRPMVLDPVPCVIANQPRASKSDPPRGIEAAIPLRELFPGTVAPGARVGLIAGLGSTGESGATLLASNPLRATLGGRPAPNPWMSNQFLPSQPNVVSDPGTSAVALQSRISIPLLFAQEVSANAVQVSPGPVRNSGRRGSWLQTLQLANVGAQAVAGPVSIVVHLPAGVMLANRSGVSLRDVSRQYVVASRADIPVGGVVTVVLEYVGGGTAPSATFEIRSGRGIL